ncbi:MAG TPA: hypothetical protein VGP07_07445 [Polyangia bacterium]|jgi:hypothetical protein
MKAGLVVATAMIVALVAVRLSRATSPCNPYHSVALTGTLVEVRQDDVVVPAGDPIFSALPPTLCFKAPLAGTRSVFVADCNDSRYQAAFLVDPP